jgi:hypothetical protein
MVRKIHIHGLLLIELVVEVASLKRCHESKRVYQHYCMCDMENMYTRESSESHQAKRSKEESAP